MEVRKRKSESVSSFLYRFNKRVQQTGVLKEVKRRRVKTRPVNRGARRKAALYRTAKASSIARAKKYGNK